MLGLTPVSLPAFLCGTVVGMSGWAAAYASLGGASRALLRRGMNMEELFAGAKTVVFLDCSFPVPHFLFVRPMPAQGQPAMRC